MSSPIADLSYRNYDGPLEAPMARWWPIALVGIRKAFKNKWFWVNTVLSGLWYMILMIIFYFVDMFATQMAGGGQAGMSLDPEAATRQMLGRVNWNELFLHGFSRGQLWFFIIALLIGAGTIANDNRANALLVYLSKPCTKLDYVIGKWVGIFIPLVVATAIPTFFFYGYCFMSYRDNGFLSDPWLILKLCGLIILPGAFHASVLLGISSLFKQGRLAGATYAALFFFSYFFTIAMGAMHMTLASSSQPNPLVTTLYYFSVDGLQIGLAKNILGRIGEQPVPFMSAGTARQMEIGAVPAPDSLLIFGVMFFVCAVSILLAWSRVRAVEVVG